MGINSITGVAALFWMNAASLDPLDRRTLEASQGWLELGDHQEADRELDRLSPGSANHPDVLLVRWHIYHLLDNQQACLRVAEVLTDVAPAKPEGWINRGNSLFYLKRHQEAYDLLMAVIDRFPQNVAFPYNLACYACALGDLVLGRKWLVRTITQATRNGSEQQLRQKILNDTDLKPLWSELDKLV